MAAPVYLDNNATTRVADEVIAAMTPWYRDSFGNPHAIHSLGRRSHAAVEEARGAVAALVGCSSDELIFTSCGTEGNALVLRGLLDTAPPSGRRRIVATTVEHPSVLTLLRMLERRGDAELELIPVSGDGEIDLDAARRAIDGRTLLVTVMLAQNETGVIHPVAEIASLARAAGALVHVDAVQAAGKIPLSHRDLDADFVTISGHKFHAPKGIGALSIRRGVSLSPLWYGGGQEHGLRSGTEPVPSIVGLAEAARLAREGLDAYPRLAILRDRLEAALRDTITEVSVNGASQPRLANTASISFHRTPADALVRALDHESICVSAGAACHSGSVEPSATMRAMAKPLDVAMGAVRFSLSRYTTEKEIEQTIAAVQRVVPGLRGG